MSAIDDANTALAVAIGVRARRKALVSLAVAAIDALSETDPNGEALATEEQRYAARLHAIGMVEYHARLAVTERSVTTGGSRG